MQLVAVVAVGARTVPVPGVGIDCGDDPARGHPLSYPCCFGSVVGGGDLDVLARHDPQQLDRCCQAGIVETGAEPDDGLGVAEQLRDQSSPRPGVCPHDLRLALPPVVVARQQPGQHRCGPGIGVERCQRPEALADPGPDQRDRVLGQHAVRHTGRVHRAAMADHPSALGRDLDTIPQKRLHPGAHQTRPELHQHHMRDPAMLQRQTQRRFPRHVEPRPPLSLTVRHPIEQPQQQQRRHHRRRMRPPTTARRIQRIKIGITEQLAPSLPQRRQKTLRVEQAAHHHPDIENRTLTISRTAHPTIIRDHAPQHQDPHPNFPTTLLEGARRGLQDVQARIASPYLETRGGRSGRARSGPTPH